MQSLTGKERKGFSVAPARTGHKPMCAQKIAYTQCWPQNAFKEGMRGRNSPTGRRWNICGAEQSVASPFQSQLADSRRVSAPQLAFPLCKKRDFLQLLTWKRKKKAFQSLRLGQAINLCAQKLHQYIQMARIRQEQPYRQEMKHLWGRIACCSPSHSYFARSRREITVRTKAILFHFGRVYPSTGRLYGGTVSG